MTWRIWMASCIEFTAIERLLSTVYSRHSCIKFSNTLRIDSCYARSILYFGFTYQTMLYWRVCSTASFSSQHFTAAYASLVTGPTCTVTPIPFVTVVEITIVWKSLIYFEVTTLPSCLGWMMRWRDSITRIPNLFGKSVFWKFCTMITNFCCKRLWINR